MTLTVRAADRGPGIPPRRTRGPSSRSCTSSSGRGSRGDLHPRHRRGRQVHPPRGVRRSRRGPAARSSCASTAARSSRPRAASSTRSRSPPVASSRRSMTRRRGSRASVQRVVVALDRYEVLRPLDLWLQQSFVPALDDRVRVVIAGREAPMAGWSTTMGAAVPEPAAGQPAARGRRDAAAPGRRSPATTSSASSGSPGPPAVAAARGDRARGRARPRSRGDDGDGDRRGADRALPGPSRPADAARARRGVRRPAADPVADRRDAPRRRAPGRVRPPARASRSSSSAATASSSTTPSGRSWPPTCARRIPTGRDATGSPRGGSSAARSRGRPRTRCGATPRTCCTSSRTRPCARRSSRRRSTVYFVDPAHRGRLAGDPRHRDGVRATRVRGDPRGLVATPAGRVLGGA